MLQKVQNGSIPDIFKHYHKVMYATAYKVLGNSSDAEDAVQDAFEKILRSPDTVLRIPFDDLKAYLIVISRNSAYTLLRKNSKYIAMPLEDADDFLFDSADNPEEAMMTQLDNIDIFNLPKMKDKYRDVIILMYYYDFSVSKTAEVLNISEGNVRVRVHRALEQIRQFGGPEYKMGVKDIEE